ncbi:MAG: CPBP family intramembrane metalloprotease [Acidimicrobiales bacterium]|nr:CPBP family intramembrane metalloprotease [Acidimicrobiales bacterium]
MNGENENEIKWSLFDVALGLVVAIVLESVAVAIWASVSGGKVAAPNTAYPFGEEVSGFFGFWVGLVGTVVLASRFRGTGSLVKDLGLRVKLIDVPLGLSIGVACQVVAGWLIYLPFYHLVPSLKQNLSTPAKQLTGSGHGVTFLALAILICICAPFVEELFFRGLLLSSLKTSLKRGFGQKATKWLSISISAVVFGLVHFELLQLPGLIILGLVLGYMVTKTGRLATSMFTHAGFNAVTVFWLWKYH